MTDVPVPDVAPSQDEVQSTFNEQSAALAPQRQIADIERRLFRGATLNEINFDYEVLVQALNSMSFSPIASTEVRVRARALAEHFASPSGEQLQRFAEFLAESGHR